MTENSARTNRCYDMGFSLCIRDTLTRKKRGLWFIEIPPLEKGLTDASLIGFFTRKVFGDSSLISNYCPLTVDTNIPLDRVHNPLLH